MFSWRIKTRRGRLDLRKAWGTWSRFAPYIRPHRWSLVIALGASLGAIGAEIAAPWPIKFIFDGLLSSTPGSVHTPFSSLNRLIASATSDLGRGLLWVCLAILLIAVVDAAFAYARDVLLARTAHQVVGRIRRDVFSHLQSLTPDVFDRHRTGDLLLRLTGDIQMLRQMLIDALVTGAEGILLIAATVAAMFWLNPTLAALGVATVPFILWSTWRISRQIRKSTDESRDRESVVATIAHDVLGAMPIVQAFNREEMELKRFARQNRSSIRASVKTTKLESRLYRTVAVASAVGMCVILYVGVRLILAGAMTAGDLLVFLAYLRGVNKPMRRLGKLAGQIAKATACGQRVHELFMLRPAVTSRDGAVAIERARGEIRYEHVTFGYDADRPALAEVNLHIRPGQRVAIVGHTGAGKSTLAKLLLRFYDPQGGAIRLDGHDLRDLTLESLRRQIAWVHQDTVLFGMSIEENIALGRPDATIEEIAAAARAAQATEFIDALPEGFATILGQCGQTLSGGQRQRLALARALLRQAPVLLLDEPATGLDARTRALVEQAWMSPENRATTLVICHRLEDMHRFDQIVVLSAGRVREVGEHHALLAACGEYADMIAAARAGGPAVMNAPAPAEPLPAYVPEEMAAC